MHQFGSVVKVYNNLKCR